MVISYDNRKKSYDSMDDSQKQQYNDMLKNKGDDYVGNQYMKQYNQQTNNTPQSNNNSSNFYNQNGTNGQNQTNFDTPTVQKTESQNNNQNNQTYNYDPNEKLDTSMFGASDGKVVVKEGTAQQTGKPDYQLDSDARTREITDNLNAYWQTNREYFQDRNTYNNMFHYNERSDQQKAILDSYWKKKEDMNVAEKYNTADGIKSGMNDADITPDQLNYIKEYSPEAYKEWQQKQIDDINLRIANLATPADPTDNAELFNSLLNKLGLEPGDPYQIYDNWYDMAERLGVFSDSEKLKSYQNQLDQNHSKMESIMSRYSASTGGTVSDALAAARMNKALAPYQQREVDLQNSYTTLLNGRNSNLAIANQSAQALAMQAQEDQRIWNQRLQGLGFAMNTASYRSPEQQAQLKLQTASIQNDMNLLQTSMQNDLNRYNAYATAKMQNQLQQELTDLSVEDENQLKANLNNALSDYYKNYGNIIQRSQAQAVDDIIAYAKKKGISVAQAMTENFIKPLQNKAEYKQKIASDYGMIAKQSIGTINGRSVIMTTNPNGSISYKYIDDPYDTGIASMYSVGDTNYVKLTNGETMTAEEYNKKYGNKVGTVKPYDMVDSKVFDTSPVSHSYYTLADFMADAKNQEGQKGGQCAKFVNDYLEKIGVGRYFGTEDVKTRESWCNSDTAKVGTIAVFDYDHYIDGKNYGHVGIVVDTDENGFWVLDSNGDLKKPGVIEKRYIRYGSSSCKGFFDPSQPPRTNTVSTSVGGLTSSQLEDLAKQYINGDKSYSDIKATYGEDVLKAVGLKASQMGYETPTETSNIVTDNDIYNYNDATLNRKMSAEDRQKVLDARNAVYSDPNASIDEILRFSQGGKTPTDTSVQSLDKYAQALTSLGQLTDLLKDANTGPIIGALRSKNPYDKKAREINTAIAGLLPTLARGVYGEVGVLTDKDIEHYSQTVPNLRSTSEVNDAILAMSLDMLADGYKRKLQTQAALGYDVSGMKGIYDQIISKANQLKNNIGISDSATGPQDVISDIYSSAMNTNTSYSSNGGNASYGGYSSDFISQMINSKL